MEERGQAISDGKPIQHAKRAIAQDRVTRLQCLFFFENIEQFQNIFFSFCNPKKLTKENCELDVRIAVIEHEITQKVLKMATAH